MAYAIKTEISDPQAETFVFAAQKTMYGGKRIAEGDVIFLLASENEGGQGLIASGVVTSSEATPRRPDLERQTPRVAAAVRRTALRRGVWAAMSSSVSRTGRTGGWRPSSISNSTVRRPTRSSAFRTRRRRF